MRLKQIHHAWMNALWVGGRHALPPANVTLRETGNPSTNASYTVNTSVPAHLIHPPSPGINWEAVLIVAMIAVVVLIAAIITYLYSGSLAPPRGGPPPAAPRIEVEEPPSTYFYEGLRRELRKIYEALLVRLAKIGVMLKPGYTPREVAAASAPTRLGRMAGRLASIYEEYMYGPQYPSKSIVEEARRLVRGEE